MTVCNCGKAHYWKTDGGLWHGPSYLVPELIKSGTLHPLIVDNPKRWYAPEYDTTNPNYKSEIPRNDSDILEVTIL